MNSIEFLKGIGLAEVSRKTHIDADYLSHIVNKDYEKLTRLNTKGFIKILQREYDIDFEEWLNGYESFLKEHEAEKHESRITVEPSVSSYKSVSKSSYGFLWTVILLAILAIGAWFFELYKYFDEFPNLFRDENQSVSYSNTTTVQAARQNLIILKEENGSLLLPPPEENTSMEPIRDVPALSAEDNATDRRQINSEEQNSTSPNEEFDLSGLKEIQIIPAKKLFYFRIGASDYFNRRIRRRSGKTARRNSDNGYNFYQVFPLFKTVNSSKSIVFNLPFRSKNLIGLSELNFLIFVPIFSVISPCPTITSCFLAVSMLTLLSVLSERFLSALKSTIPIHTFLAGII